MKFGPETIFLLITFVIAEVIGLTFGLYEPEYHFDLLMHFIGGMLVSSVLIYYLVDYLKRFSFGVNIVITLGIGAAWEIVEFLLDQTLGWSMQLGLFDTMTDLITVLIAAIVINMTYWHMHRKKK